MKAENTSPNEIGYGTRCWNFFAACCKKRRKNGALPDGLSATNITFRSATHITEEQRFPYTYGNEAVQLRTWTNKIKTSQYTWWNFLPLNLLQQVTIPSNTYFLIMAALQLVQAVSDSGGVPTFLVPIFVVMSVTMLKDAYEDAQRHKSDTIENMSSCRVVTEEGITDVKWRSLRPGDIVKVQADEQFPADLILLTCSDPYGISYLETVQLDGETNLKDKTSLPELMEMFPTPGSVATGKFEMTCVAPDARLYHFNGTLRLFDNRFNEAGGEQHAGGRVILTRRVVSGLREGDSISPTTAGSPTGSPGPAETDPFNGLPYVEFPMNMNQFVWRGTSLVNTEWACGMVVYSGDQTKIFKNSKSRVLKYSRLLRTYNKHAMILAITQFLLCLMGALVSATWTVTSDGHWYLHPSSDDSAKQRNAAIGYLFSLGVAFGRFVLLLSYFVPITLFVQLEIVKWVQAYFLIKDQKLISPLNGVPPQVQTVSLMEELGCITHVFTDKTGTLTLNLMQLRCLGIGRELYGTPDTADPLMALQTYVAGDGKTSGNPLKGSGVANPPSQRDLDLLRKCRIAPNQYCQFDAYAITLRLYERHWQMRGKSNLVKTPSGPQNAAVAGLQNGQNGASVSKQVRLTETLEDKNYKRQDSVCNSHMTRIRQFLLVLCLCHSVLPKKDAAVEEVDPTRNRLTSSAVRRSPDDGTSHRSTGPSVDISPKADPALTDGSQDSRETRPPSDVGNSWRGGCIPTDEATKSAPQNCDTPLNVPGIGALVNPSKSTSNSHEATLDGSMHHNHTKRSDAQTPSSGFSREAEPYYVSQRSTARTQDHGSVLNSLSPLETNRSDLTGDHHLDKFPAESPVRESRRSSRRAEEKFNFSSRFHEQNYIDQSAGPLSSRYDQQPLEDPVQEPGPRRAAPRRGHYFEKGPRRRTILPAVGSPIRRSNSSNRRGSSHGPSIESAALTLSLDKKGLATEDLSESEATPLASAAPVYEAGRWFFSGIFQSVMDHAASNLGSARSEGFSGPGTPGGSFFTDKAPYSYKGTAENLPEILPLSPNVRTDGTTDNIALSSSFALDLPLQGAQLHKSPLNYVLWRRSTEVNFDASSPDELSLVSGATHLGLQFLRRPSLTTIEIALTNSLIREILLDGHPSLQNELLQARKRLGISSFGDYFPFETALQYKEAKFGGGAKKGSISRRSSSGLRHWTSEGIDWLSVARIFERESSDDSNRKSFSIVPTLLFDTLEVLEFDNVRKKMSVITKDLDGRLCLLSKGADSAMIASSTTDGDAEFLTILQGQLEDLSHQGLRTLVFGYRELSLAELEAFRRELAVAKLANDESAVIEVYNKLETNLHLVGCSGIDDKLQPEVPETIAALKTAGIKLWVLTGDKLETAVSIGHSCNVLTDSTYNAIINGRTETQVREQLHRYMSFIVAGQLAREAFDAMLHGSQTTSRATDGDRSAADEFSIYPKSSSGSDDEQPKNRCGRFLRKPLLCLRPRTAALKRIARKGGRTAAAAMNWEDFVRVITFQAKHKSVVSEPEQSNPAPLTPRQVQTLIQDYLRAFEAAATEKSPTRADSKKGKRKGNETRSKRHTPKDFVTSPESTSPAGDIEGSSPDTVKFSSQPLHKAAMAFTEVLSAPSATSLSALVPSVSPSSSTLQLREVPTLRKYGEKALAIECPESTQLCASSAAIEQTYGFPRIATSASYTGDRTGDENLAFCLRDLSCTAWEHSVLNSQPFCSVKPNSVVRLPDPPSENEDSKQCFRPSATGKSCPRLLTSSNSFAGSDGTTSLPEVVKLNRPKKRRHQRLQQKQASTAIFPFGSHRKSSAGCLSIPKNGGSNEALDSNLYEDYTLWVDELEFLENSPGRYRKSSRFRSNSVLRWPKLRFKWPPTTPKQGTWLPYYTKQNNQLQRDELDESWFPEIQECQQHAIPLPDGHAVDHRVAFSEASPASEDLARAVERYTAVAITCTGEALGYVLADDDIKRYFFGLANLCNTVIACRVTPKQKAEVVREAAHFLPGTVSLGVGDGANDVGMIITANVGVGIAGKEGMQAVRAADFAVGEFRFLKNLLFHHGHEDLRRNSLQVYHTVYKNVVFGLADLLFGFFSVFSATDIYSLWLKQIFNLIFTSVPAIVYSWTDRMLPADIFLGCPWLYPVALKPNGSLYFGEKRLLYWMVYALISTTLILVLPLYSLGLNGGHSDGTGLNDRSTFGHTAFFLIVIVSNATLVPFFHTWFWFVGVAFLISFGFWYMVWSVCSSGFRFCNDVEGSLRRVDGALPWHASVFLTCFVVLGLMMLGWFVRMMYFPSPAVIIRERIAKGVFDVVVAPRTAGGLAVVVPRRTGKAEWRGFAFSEGTTTRLQLHRRLSVLPRSVITQTTALGTAAGGLFWGGGQQLMQQQQQQQRDAVETTPSGGLQSSLNVTKTKLGTLAEEDIFADQSKVSFG